MFEFLILKLLSGTQFLRRLQYVGSFFFSAAVPKMPFCHVKPFVLLAEVAKVTQNMFEIYYIFYL